ncbi:hypothetical protein [Zooshikella harenae]|uniref:TetR/AcrR family transcriptional regulator n=1 Tax=Zooshikella harenae TaxID=2827238 RepID=A0ABS5ZHN4_9GAMM|nr:hypothetical protein [Zooshikella harenae]MBU2713485.1 hypothetical protein [Zooshikella harenae]
MIIQTLSRIIDKTLKDGATLKAYNRYLVSEAADLSQILHLPKNEIPSYVQGFVLSYIRAVPKLLNYVEKLFKKYHILDDWLPALKVMVNFFIAPMDLVKRQSDIHQLMLEAYLAMRILEEINEFFLDEAHTPLLPDKIAYVNVVMHTIIGESIARILDEVVFEVVHSMLPDRQRLSHELQQFLGDLAEQKQKILPNWPAMDNELDLSVFIHTAHIS